MLHFDLPIPNITLTHNEAVEKLSKGYIKVTDFTIYHYPTSALEECKSRFRLQHWRAISRYQLLDEDFLITNREQLQWSWLKMRFPLSQIGLKELRGYVSMMLLHRDQMLPQELIEELLEEKKLNASNFQIDWKFISSNTMMNRNFVIKYAQFLSLEKMKQNEYLHKELLEEFQVLLKLMRGWKE